MTGHNLNIVIRTICNSYTEWMAFACWYSIHEKLPEATIYIAQINPQGKYHYLRWIDKAGIKRFRFCSENKFALMYHLLRQQPKEKILLIEHDVVLVRDLESFSELKGRSEDNAVWLVQNITATDFKELNFQNIKLCCNCTESKQYPFTQYKSTCGAFSKEKWLKSNIPPFSYTKQLQKEGMTTNEKAILDLWAKMEQTFIILR